ncbi:MAG: right-handed parallel beta-helix repeat-containing protein, partial [Planctomycetota bacterium]
NFNLFYPLGAGQVGYWQGARPDLRAWRFASTYDADGLQADPLFVDMAGADAVTGYDRGAGVDYGADDDFHLQSTVGSYHNGDWLPDAGHSPAIDRGDDADAYDNEPAPDGGYRNLGAYGNTPEASLSPAQYVLVISPNGGEQWAQTSDQTVKWRSDGFAGTIDIHYTPDNGGSWLPLAADVPNVDSWLWENIATPISDQYLIRIEAHDDAGIVDVSDALFAVTVPIAFYYVDDTSDAGDQYTPGFTGDNGNDGLSPSTPMASVWAVLDAYDMNPGDRIFVDTGVYSVTSNILIEYLDSGVTIIGPTVADQHAVLVRGNIAGGNYVFELRDAHYVSIRNLSITNANTGVYIADASTYATLADNVIYDNADYGVYIADSDSSHVTLTGNTFYGTTGNNDTDQEYGVRAYGSSPTVTGNTAYHTPGTDLYGMRFEDIGAGEFTDNTVYNNSHTGLWLRGTDLTVTGNTVHDNVTGMYIDDTHSGTYAQVHGNTVYNNTTGISTDGYDEVFDNEVYGNTSSGIWTGTGDWRLIHDNEVYRNYDGLYLRCGSASDNRVWGQTNVGIRAGYTSVDIDGNVSYGNAYGMYISADYGGVNVRNNLVYDNTYVGIQANSAMAYGTSVEIVNNTVYEPGVPALTIVNDSKNVHLRNNILSSQTSYELYVSDNSQNGFASDYNLFHYDGTGPFLYWQQDWTSQADWFLEIGFDEHSLVVTDPMFVDVDGPDDVLGVAGPGLDASYWDNEDFTGDPVLTRTDFGIDFNWSTGSPGTGVPSDNFSARWEGYVLIPAAGDWTFYSLADNGERFYFGGVGETLDDLDAGDLRIDHWDWDGGAEQSWLAEGLAQGMYPIRYEMHEVNTYAKAHLKWKGPDVDKQVIPRWNLSDVPVLGDFGIDDDLHLQSTHGSYHGGSWLADAADSPGIDAADPSDTFGDEPTPNGDRRNLGAYGNTDEASKSPANYIQVMFPNGSDKLRVGEGEIITWRSGGAVGSVNILFSRDGGGAWETLASGVPDDGDYAWNPSGAPTQLGLIRVEDATDPAVGDNSDSTFALGPAGSDYYLNIPGDPDTGDNEYTNASGHNANSGTHPDFPMASLRALLAAYDLGPGDTVWVDTGTYSLFATVEIGAQDSGMTIRGPVEAGNEAVFDRANREWNVFELRGAEDVTVEHITLTGGNRGLWAGESTLRLTLDHLTARDNKQTGAYLAAGSNDATIVHSTFYGTTGSDNTDQNRGLEVYATGATVDDSDFYHTPGSHGEGLYARDISDITATNNEAWANATGMWVRAANYTVSGNVVHDNTTGMYLDDTNGGTYGEAFGNEAYGNTTGINSDGFDEVYDNDVHDNSGSGIRAGYNDWRTIHDNEVYRNEDGIWLQRGVAEHNRVWGSSVVGIRGAAEDAYIRHNVIYGNTYGVYV